MADSKPSPFVSVVMPVYETPGDLLRRSIVSVLDQSFRDLELIAIDDGSTSTEVREILTGMARSDDRLRVIFRETNTGIAAASNDGLRVASGTFVTFVDHDDLLEPTALETCADVLRSNDDCDLLYTDEARVDRDDGVVSRFLKPDWSPERLRSQNYVNHLSLYRRSLVEAVGGFRIGFDGSQDYDLVLRVSELARKIVHIPEVLYHWRLVPGQVSGTGDPGVYDAARRAIEDHCARTGRQGWVEQTHPLGVYRVHRQIAGNPLVSIVIPTRGSSGLIRGERRCFVVEALKSIIEELTYPNVEIVVVADTEMSESTAAQLADLCGDRLRLVWYDLPFNYSHKVNRGVVSAAGEYVLLLNDDIEVITPDWIETMLGLAQETDVGMVGAALYFEDGTIQHAGHLYRDRTGIGHIGYGIDGSLEGPEFTLRVERECSGVTAACAMLRRSDYLAVGGLSRDLPMNFNDVDLSLKIRATGKRIIWTPFAKLYHFESKTRDVFVGPAEVDCIQRRWGHVFDLGDPYWRHLELTHAPRQFDLVVD